MEFINTIQEINKKEVSLKEINSMVLKFLNVQKILAVHYIIDLLHARGDSGLAQYFKLNIADRTLVVLSDIYLYLREKPIKLII